ncbi:response regulator [Candidatus Omnitrophota bacterium]
MEKPRILVIDDEREFLNLMAEQLELGGYEVVTAINGEEGLKQIKKCSPDLVICDVKMPKKDGFEVLKEVKKDKGSQTPFLMVTAVDDFDKMKEAYAGDVDFYVTKPVKFENLLKNIRIILSLSKSKI